MALEDPIRNALAAELAHATGIEELELAQATLKFYDLGLIEVGLDENGRPTSYKLPVENAARASAILQANQSSKEE